jgi:membrane-associated protease RseP (regulator of RpoE activity)
MIAPAIPGEFLNHPRWQRFIVAIAGPAMNVLLAFGPAHRRLHGALRISRRSMAPPLWAGSYPTRRLPKAGMQIGDQIVKVDDVEPTPTWEQVDLKEALSPNQPLKFEMLNARAKSPTSSSCRSPWAAMSMATIGLVPKEPAFIATMSSPACPRKKPASRSATSDSDASMASPSPRSKRWSKCLPAPKISRFGHRRSPQTVRNLTST